MKLEQVLHSIPFHSILWSLQTEIQYYLYVLLEYMSIIDSLHISRISKENCLNAING